MTLPINCVKQQIIPANISRLILFYIGRQKQQILHKATFQLMNQWHVNNDVFGTCKSVHNLSVTVLSYWKLFVNSVWTASGKKNFTMARNFRLGISGSITFPFHYCKQWDRSHKIITRTGPKTWFKNKTIAEKTNVENLLEHHVHSSIC